MAGGEACGRQSVQGPAVRTTVVSSGSVAIRQEETPFPSDSRESTTGGRVTWNSYRNSATTGAPRSGSLVGTRTAQKNGHAGRSPSNGALDSADDVPRSIQHSTATHDS